MERIPVRLAGPALLQPRMFGDERGFFMETFRASTLAELGVPDAFVQDNHSRSGYGVIRGMHYQLDPPAGKLVRCARGRILDVLVDIRPGSATFGEWEGYELSDANGRMLWAPPGFAHGFCVLSEVADVLYKQTAYWSAEGDGGIAFDDPAVGIAWPIPEAERIVSERDRRAPRLAEVEPELAAAQAGARDQASLSGG
jgi:dTDP-4-dehydrorhamnose 3,5-epimerase